MKRMYVFLGVLAMLAVLPAAYAQVPPVPTDLVAHASTGFYPSVNLEWKLMTPMAAPEGVLFRVYRSADDSAHFSMRDVVISRSFRDYDVSPGHTYFYYVTSVLVHDTSSTESSPSNIASAALDSSARIPHGIISGTVTDSATGKPLSLVRILFYKSSARALWVPQTWTDTAGHYKAVLDTGTYLVNAQPWRIMEPVVAMMMSVYPVFLPYLPEWYDDAKTPAQATPVMVSDSSQFTADFDLMRLVPPTYAKVQGTVTDSSGNALKGAFVVFARTAQDLTTMTAIDGQPADLDDAHITIDGLGCVRGVIWSGRTDSSGHYAASLLTNRSYVGFAWKSGYLPQWFDHESTPQDADPITFTQDTSGIDFSLSPKPVATGSISGAVMDSAGTAVASRIILIPLSPLPFVSSIRAGFTDSLGEYTIANVEPGQYFVLAIPFSGYAPAFYKAGAFGELHWKNADTVTVADAAVGGIDIGVVPIQTRGFAHFGGHVRSGGRGLGGVNVFAIDADGAVVGYALSNPDGSVSMEGLPSGSIGLVADKEEYNPASGSVDIAAGASTVTGSDLILSPTGTTSVPRQPDAPLNFSLDQNYPNPFNPSTRISFTLPIQSNVTLTVYNILGQVVATLENGSLTAGSHDAIWTGRDNEGRGVASGIYFYRLNAAGVNGQTFTSLRKMVFLK